jgi:hypothetical protein
MAPKLALLSVYSYIAESGHPYTASREGAGRRRAQRAGPVGWRLPRLLRSVACDAGISEDTPIHVTETGWPTGHTRDEAKQARILQSVAEAVIATGEVSVYEFFSLRDGISDGTWHNGFGILYDDYTPKLAFDVVRRIIEAR